MRRKKLIKLPHKWFSCTNLSEGILKDLAISSLVCSFEIFYITKGIVRGGWILPWEIITSSVTGVRFLYQHNRTRGRKRGCTKHIQEMVSFTQQKKSFSFPNEVNMEVFGHFFPCSWKQSAMGNLNQEGRLKSGPLHMCGK